MFEDISVCVLLDVLFVSSVTNNSKHSGDGGIYAELIRNRDFAGTGHHVLT
jgi:hypothetical protein